MIYNRAVALYIKNQSNMYIFLEIRAKQVEEVRPDGNLCILLTRRIFIFVLWKFYF